MASKYENLPIEAVQEHPLGLAVKYKGGPTVLMFKPIYGRGSKQSKDDYVYDEDNYQPSPDEIATSFPTETKASIYNRLKER